MGYAVYEDTGNRRWAGYGVPAECDMDGCHAEIDRGADFKCETYVREVPVDEDGLEVDEDDAADFVEREEDGCGLFFCEDHQQPFGDHTAHEKTTPKPDSDEWKQHQMTDPSWGDWRHENGFEVAEVETNGNR